MFSYGSFTLRKNLLIAQFSSMKFGNALFFPVLELPIIGVLYEWSGVCAHVAFCYFLSSPITSSKLILFTNFLRKWLRALFLHSQKPF